jgi:outer membrane protein assembly factor BamB
MKKTLLALGGLVLLLGGVVLAVVLYKQHQARNIRGSSTVEFVTTATPKPRTPAELSAIPWPTFGYDPAHTRFADGITVRPPFRRVWAAGLQSLLEFPPAIGYGKLYLTTNSGIVTGLSTSTGQVSWTYASGRCSASSPAIGRVGHGTVYQTLLNKPPCNASGGGLDGEIVALSAGQGHVRWRRRIGPSESSPLLANKSLYAGDWDGKLYALVPATGRIRWSFQSGGPIKGAPAFSEQRLFFGSYDHHVYALDARTGKLLWRTAAQDRLGQQGSFYSTAAVAYGRVYIGSTDGKVYSFGAASGRLRWSHSTGGYVYGSPAVWKGRVLIGSYSGTFYALDAATGDILWTFAGNGSISGSATVIDGIVYFATLNGTTYGLDAATGRQVWSFPDGKYTPVVADVKRLYLVGRSAVYAFRSKQ